MKNKKENRIVLLMLIGTILISGMISGWLLWTSFQSYGIISICFMILEVLCAGFCLYTITRLIKFLTNFDVIDWVVDHMDIVGRE